jgi:hypothetical protein
MPPKKDIHEKLVFCLKKWQSLKFFGNNFFQEHFVTKVSLYFWNLQKITNFLIPIMTNFKKKIVPLLLQSLT